MAEGLHVEGEPSGGGKNPAHGVGDPREPAGAGPVPALLPGLDQGPSPLGLSFHITKMKAVGSIEEPCS